MKSPTEKTKVLITVMTYPHPSKSYKELVCTAGVTESGEWVRLYPVDYRYLPNAQRFQKWQWIEVSLSKRDGRKDKRKESREPDLHSIKPVGLPIDTKNKWQKRREFIDHLPVHTVRKLRELYNKDKTSLGVVKPAEIIDLKYELQGDNWKPQWEKLFAETQLFGERMKPLAKIPYKFSYVFRCEDDKKPRSHMMEDWELGVLFLKERVRLGSDEKAAESVRKKFLDEVCREDKDTRFFMGTVFPYNSWVVIGTFWPPKEKQKSIGF